MSSTYDFIIVGGTLTLILAVTIFVNKPKVEPQDVYSPTASPSLPPNPQSCYLKPAPSQRASTFVRHIIASIQLHYDPILTMAMYLNPSLRSMAGKFNIPVVKA
jgi:hypothetical protein